MSYVSSKYHIYNTYFSKKQFFAYKQKVYRYYSKLRYLHTSDTVIASAHPNLTDVNHNQSLLNIFNITVQLARDLLSVSIFRAKYTGLGISNRSTS